MQGEHQDRYIVYICIRSTRDCSKQQGKRFYQDKRTMKKLFPGEYDIHIMTNYCWRSKKYHLYKDYTNQNFICETSNIQNCIFL